jgi:hypothetical protein
VAPAFTKIQQLVVQVAGRLASNAWIVPIGPRTALVTMTGRASQRALGHGILERRGSGCYLCAAEEQGSSCQQLDEETGPHAVNFTPPRFVVPQQDKDQVSW